MSAHSFLQLVLEFRPVVSSGDEDWEFFFPIKKKWHGLWVKRYQKTFYLSGTHLDPLEIGPSRCADALQPGQASLLKEYGQALRWTRAQVKKDPVNYYGWLNRSLPPELRKGVVPRKIVRRLLPEYMRFDKELGKASLRETVQWLRRPPERESVTEMTAGLFFKYCRIAYRANPETHPGTNDPALDGRAIYMKWADGRDEGLSKLPLDDADAFRKWYEDGSRWGGHPWEIYRGGNSTHIDLAVYRENPAAEWRVRLDAFSSTRLAETCRIAMALQREGLPFVLGNRESYLARLTAEDHIGVVPEGDDLKYGWHKFPKEFHVADCVYFSWFRDPDAKARHSLATLKRVISWFPLCPLELAGL